MNRREALQSIALVGLPNIGLFCEDYKLVDRLSLDRLKNGEGGYFSSQHIMKYEDTLWFQFNNINISETEIFNSHLALITKLNDTYFIKIKEFTNFQIGNLFLVFYGKYNPLEKITDDYYKTTCYFDKNHPKIKENVELLKKELPTIKRMQKLGFAWNSDYLKILKEYEN